MVVLENVGRRGQDPNQVADPRRIRKTVLCDLYQYSSFVIS
jgi:hypothetical protein